jgi:hypothetical protein
MQEKARFHIIYLVVAVASRELLSKQRPMLEVAAARLLEKETLTEEDLDLARGANQAERVAGRYQLNHHSIVIAPRAAG